MKKSSSLVSSRRQFLTNILPAGTFLCFGGSNLFASENREEKQPELKFEDRIKELVGETVEQFNMNSKQVILCHCLSCDAQKKQILLSLGAEPYAALPGFIRINNKLQDTIIYKLTRKL